MAGDLACLLPPAILTAARPSLPLCRSPRGTSGHYCTMGKVKLSIGTVVSVLHDNLERCASTLLDFTIHRKICSAVSGFHPRDLPTKCPTKWRPPKLRAVSLNPSNRTKRYFGGEVRNATREAPFAATNLAPTLVRLVYDFHSRGPLA